MADHPSPSPYRFLGTGLELGGTVLVMAAIGYGIDQWLESEQHWGVLVMSTIGIVGGLYNLIKQVIRDGSK
ncbi:MAG: AtpZ/AtpI family protein [Planctomycetota bacterium]